MERIKGKIIKGVGGLYEVLATESPQLPQLAGKRIFCRARGVFRLHEQTPLAGDNVLLRVESAKLDENNIFIEEILQRKNCLIRPPIANLDCLFITLAAAKPSPSLLMIDKLTAICEHNGIEPFIIINKNDLDADFALELARIYKKAGYKTFAVSAFTKDGVAELQDAVNNALRGHVAAFAGASGVGKSSCMNLLFPTLSLHTAQISPKISRGRHTTRSTELFLLELPEGSGLLADTPGFGLLDFVNFDFFELDNLAACFPEFEPYIGRCRYTKCTHLREEGCAVLAALEAGEIAKSRHESFREIYKELKQRKYKKKT